MSLPGEQPTDRDTVIKQEQPDDNSNRSTFEVLYLPGGSGLQNQTLGVDHGLLQTKIKNHRPPTMPALEISRATKIPQNLQVPQRFANPNVATNIWPQLLVLGHQNVGPSTSSMTLKRSNFLEAAQSVNKMQCLRSDIECLSKNVQNLQEEENSASTKSVLMSVNQQVKNLVKAVDCVSGDVRLAFESNQMLMAEVKKLRKEQERQTELMEKLLTMLPAANTGQIDVDPLQSVVEMNADPVSSSSLMPQTLPSQPFSQVVHYGDSLPLTSSELVSAVDTANGRPSTLLLNLLRAIFPPDELLSCTLTTACPQKKFMVRAAYEQGLQNMNFSMAEIKEFTSVTKFHGLFNNALQANKKTQNYVRKSKRSVTCECCKDQEMPHDASDSSQTSSSCPNNSKSDAPSASPNTVKCEDLSNEAQINNHD